MGVARGWLYLETSFKHGDPVVAAASWGDAERHGGEGGCCTAMEKYLAAICGHRWVFLLAAEF